MEEKKVSNNLMSTTSQGKLKHLILLSWTKETSQPRPCKQKFLYSVLTLQLITPLSTSLSILNFSIISGVILFLALTANCRADEIFCFVESQGRNEEKALSN